MNEESKSPPQSPTRGRTPNPLNVSQSLSGFRNRENIYRSFPIRSYSRGLTQQGLTLVDENLIPMILSYSAYDPDIHTVEEMIESGNLIGLKYLVDEMGKDVYQNSNNENPLSIATRYGHLDIFRYLVEEQKVDMNMVDDQNVPTTVISQDRWNILGQASRFGRLNIVQYILTNADGPITNLDSLNEALSIAIKYNHSDIVEYLTDFIQNKYGEDRISRLTRRTWKDAIIDSINKGNSPTPSDLEKAIMKNDMDMIDFLLRNGVDPNEMMIKYRITFLEYAILSGNLKLVKLLLEYNTNILTERHFKMAVHKKNPEYHRIVKLLLRHGLDVDADNGYALLYAVESRDMELIKLLLRHGANPDIDNLNIIKRAIEKGNAEIIELLFEYSELSAQEKENILS